MIETLRADLDLLSGAVAAFEGPPQACPVCRGEIDQLSLLLDLVGASPAVCDHCGAVLAA